MSDEIVRDTDPEFEVSHAEVLWVVNVEADEADLTDPEAIALAGARSIRESTYDPVLMIRLIGKDGSYRFLDNVDTAELHNEEER